MQHLRSIIFLSLFSQVIYAGIVEMPTVEEAPSLHGKSVFENYNIRSVNNRNPDERIGPRLWVKKISVQGIANFPELGIRTLEVEAYIERLRFAIMRENEIEEYGYSKKELADIANLLNKFDVERNYEHIGDAHLQNFLYLVREQKNKRGLSITEIEGIAEKVNDYYHSRGLELATVLLPRQVVRDGVVIFTVNPSTLGGVTVENNQLYNSNIITRVFDDILTVPVTFKNIDERSYLVNDYPGLSINGNITKGDQVGDSRLALNAVQEKALEGTLRLDNHGSELTGQYRGFAEFYWNNPTGFADQLNLSILQSSSPDNSTYGQLGYRIPLYSPRWYLSLSASTNQFILDQTQNASGTISQLGITGKTEQTNIDLSYTFKRSRESSIWFSLISDSTRTILESDEFGNLGLDDDIRNLRLSARFDKLNSKGKVLHLGSMTLSSGEFLEGAGVRDTKYTKFNADYTLMTFVPLPWFDTRTRLLFKTEFQYSGNALPSAEQNALASPTKVRAYPVNQFSTDSSLYLGTEWVFNTPELFKSDWLRVHNISHKLQPLFFIDAASGIQNTTSEADDVTGTLVDAGFGLQYDIGRHIHGNLQFAFPLKDKFSIDSISAPDDRLKIVFDFQYQF